MRAAGRGVKGVEIVIKGSAKEIAALAAEMQERQIERHDKDSANHQYAEYLGSAVRMFWRLKGLEDEEDVSEDSTPDNAPPASEE